MKNVLTLTAVLSVVLCAIAVKLHLGKAPQPPVWPDKFSIGYLVKVRDYGPTWEKPGKMFYDHTTGSMRADYYSWCLPLFDDPTNKNQNWNFTCRFLLSPKSAYFLTDEVNPITHTTCCVFEDFLPPPPPTWLKETNFTGIEVMNKQVCEKWWFDGGADLYYGYWNQVTPPRNPVRFLGLSSLNETTLEYFDFRPYDPQITPSFFKVPEGCDKLCEPEVNRKTMSMAAHAASFFRRR